MSHTLVTSAAHKPLLSLTLGAKEGDAGEARNASCLFSVLTCSAANDLSLSSKIERMWAMRGALPSRRLADKIGEEGDCFPRMTASKIQLPYSPNEPRCVRLVIVSIQKRGVYSTYHQVLWQTNLSSVFIKPPKSVTGRQIVILACLIKWIFWGGVSENSRNALFNKTKWNSPKNKRVYLYRRCQILL